MTNLLTTSSSIGFGTYQLRGEEGKQSIISALHNGYRILDTAYNYENEGTVGQAIIESGVPREEICVVSKLPGRYHEYTLARESVLESLYRLGLDYIDIYLIHWPNPIEDKYVEAWRALIDLQKEGYLKEIGVSNFLPEHIDRLYKETQKYPYLNQIELHPYFNQEDVLPYYKEKNIQVWAWSPFARNINIFNEPILQDIANKYNKTPAQIILRWHKDRGIIPIPKSSTSKRQLENIDIEGFSLSQEEIESINSLSSNSGRRKDQDPSIYQEF